VIASDLPGIGDSAISADGRDARQLSPDSERFTGAARRSRTASRIGR
jgi:hypothetical protein